MLGLQKSECKLLLGSFRMLKWPPKSDMNAAWTLCDRSSLQMITVCVRALSICLSHLVSGCVTTRQNAIARLQAKRALFACTGAEVKVKDTHHASWW